MHIEYIALVCLGYAQTKIAMTVKDTSLKLPTQ